MNEPFITVSYASYQGVNLRANGWCFANFGYVTNIKIDYKSTKESWIKLYDKNGCVGVILGVFDYGQPGIRR